jgi:hypothetical protein
MGVRQASTAGTPRSTSDDEVRQRALSWSNRRKSGALEHQASAEAQPRLLPSAGMYAKKSAQHGDGLLMIIKAPQVLDRRPALEIKNDI